MSIDRVIVKRGTNSMGSDSDTYILAENQIASNNPQITISDSGTNIIHIISGLSLSGSRVSNAALLLNLSKGGAITILSANLMTFKVGGNPLTQTGGTNYTFNQFCVSKLGVTVPSSGINSGGSVIIT